MHEYQGLEIDRGTPTFIEIGPAENVTWNLDGGVFNYTTYILNDLAWCVTWREPQHILFQLANLCFLISYAAPNNRRGLVFMHSLLVIGFILYAGWAFKVVCAPDVFIWNMAFMFLNILQLFYVIYMMRPVRFDPELEDAYQTLFRSFKVSRLTFKKLVSAEFAQIVSLHAGEAYAMQNLTKTDRLGLLLSGKANVITDNKCLHPILPCEFLDSPEWECNKGNQDDKFKVSIIAATSCRYLYWQRSSLEYLFVKETYLATVVSTLVARDIATKLYAMNNKIVTEKGVRLDIRLSSITTTFNLKRRKKIDLDRLTINHLDEVQDYNDVQREKKKKKERNERMADLTSLKTVHSDDVENWLETSSKYHSCELVED